MCCVLRNILTDRPKYTPPGSIPRQVWVVLRFAMGYADCELQAIKSNRFDSLEVQIGWNVHFVLDFVPL
jgi:hypothetical protein